MKLTVANVPQLHVVTSRRASGAHYIYSGAGSTITSAGFCDLGGPLPFLILTSFLVEW